MKERLCGASRVIGVDFNSDKFQARSMEFENSMTCGNKRVTYLVANLGLYTIALVVFGVIKARSREKIVCEKVESKGRTAYNEVADELVAELALPNDEKHPWIRVLSLQIDRVYMNTLTKIALIDHERKRTNRKMSREAASSIYECKISK
ncbi:hypothetical protein AALP_AAs56295U000100 [Arabis alpina]|uniref:Transmembrane protein n=1 Tax=Arabis alpina TaxID=50452 RepID=A0A087G1J4_ARAAL|nr:hypothetical protein AALP_AAs56295U000100 [Arabis alpina]